MTESEVGVDEADEARNRVFGAGLVDDPYPRLHELRSACPVQHGTLIAQFPEMAGLATLTPSDVPTFSTYGYETGVEVLRRSGTFKSEPFYRMLSDSIGPTVISLDEPEHRRMRMLMQPTFARRAMDRWKADIIGPIVDEHLDRIAPLGRADLYKEVGSKVPIQTISAALGLPADDREQFFHWAVAMTSTVNPPEERAAAAQAVAEYAAPLIAERRTNPRDDLLSALVAATLPEDADADLDQRPLSDDELNSFIRLFIIAGAGTTYRAYGITLFHLLSNPDQLAEVVADRSLVANAIDEAMRIDQPLTFIGRAAAQACVLDGVEVPAGSIIEVGVGSANHDPDHYDDPDRFDLHRPRADRNLTFGFGVHRCLGVHLAQAELTVMINRTFDRLPGLRFDPAAGPAKLTGLGFRMPTGLPVVWG